MAEWGVFLVTRRGETPPARAIRIGASMNTKVLTVVLRLLLLLGPADQRHASHYRPCHFPPNASIAFLSGEYRPSTQRNYYENSNSKPLRSTDILERDVGRVGSGDGVHVSRPTQRRGDSGQWQV